MKYSNNKGTPVYLDPEDLGEGAYNRKLWVRCIGRKFDSENKIITGPVDNARLIFSPEMLYMMVGMRYKIKNVRQAT